MKRRILIYSINYAPEPIGVGRYTGQLGQYLCSQGADVKVVTATPHYPGWAARDGYRNRYMLEIVAGVRVVRCPLLLRANMHGVWRLLAPLSFAMLSAPVVVWQILTFRPHAVLCIEPTLVAAPVALLAAKLTGSRRILHVQDLEMDAAFGVGHLSGGLLYKLAACYERVVHSSFDAVITISTRMRDLLVRKGVPADRLSIIRNWVDLDAIKPLAGPSKLREEFGIPESAFVALYAGNIGRKQALPLMLDAAAALEADRDILFVVAGEGPEKQMLLRTYGHLANVRFIPLQPEERLCELLNMADVHIIPQHKGAADLVLPSKIGGILASGRPCIAMAELGTELYEFLSGAAILVNPDDKPSIVRAIRAVKERAGGDTPEARIGLAQALSAGKNLKVFSETVGL